MLFGVFDWHEGRSYLEETEQAIMEHQEGV